MLHKTLDVGAVGTVHRDTATTRDEADDIVARHGIAAMCQTHQQAAVALALNDNAVARALAALLRLAVGAAGGLLHDLGDGLGLGELLLGLGIQDLLDLVAHGTRGDLTGTDGRKQVLELLIVQLLRHSVERTRRARRGNAVPALAQILGQHIATGGSVVVLSRGGKVATDLGLGRRRLDDLEPVARRLGTLVGQNLDTVARLNLVRERGHGTVDLGAHAVVANLGVDGVGKVERGGAGTERHDLALGRKDKNLLIEQINLQRVQIFLGVGDLVGGGPIERVLEPVDLVVQALGVVGLGGRRSARLFIQPVGGNAVLGLLVHLVGSNLNLERTGRGADNRRMERLVVIDLGHGDIVFKAAGHGVPQRVHRAERGVAIAHRMGNDAQRHQVVDLGELLALALHLLVDGPIVLGTTVDLEALKTNTVELVGERLDGLGQIALANLARLRHHARDALVGVGLQIEEGQVLELPLNGTHTQTIG